MQNEHICTCYMSWSDWIGGKQPTLHRNIIRFHWIIWVNFDSFPFKRKVDEIKCNFFSTIHILFFCHSHFICLENRFMQFSVKLGTWWIIHKYYLCFFFNLFWFVNKKLQGAHESISIQYFPRAIDPKHFCYEDRHFWYKYQATTGTSKQKILLKLLLF